MGTIGRDVIAGVVRMGDHVPMAVMAVDLGGKITEWSREAAVLYGWTPEEALGSDSQELLQADNRPELITEVLEALLAGQHWYGEWHARHKSGEPIEVMALNIPIARDDGKIVGVCGFSFDATYQRTHLRQALDVSQGLLDAVARATEAERARIAGELHDGIGQELSALRTELLGLWERIAGDDDHRVVIERSVGHVDAVLNEIRRICTELRPQLLDHLGLCAALDWLLNEASRRNDFTCAALIEPCDGILPQDLEIELFRVAQEALSNVERHARAGEVRLSLRREAFPDAAAVLILAIEDDGVGLPRSGRSLASMGIPIMHERARRLGGALRFGPGLDGRGTSVVMTIPIG